MEEPDPLVTASSELASMLVSNESLQEVLHRVIRLAERAVLGCSAVGVTLLEGSKWSTGAYTHPWLLAVDQGQYDLGDGPCLRAAVEQRIVQVGEADLKRVWAPFYVDAYANGVRSVFAAPLGSGDGLVGALNLYFDGPEASFGVQEELIVMYAAQASVALANSRVFSQTQALVEQLQEALVSRASIEQAKGWLMARQNIDADVAFSLLRRESQRSNKKLRDVAADVLKQVSG